MISFDTDLISECDELNSSIFKDSNNNSNENYDSNENLQKIFEDISNDPMNYNKLRQCRSWSIPKNINSIQPGQYCVIPTEGGGAYTQWYYYKTLNNRHLLIFGVFDSKKNCRTYSGREIFDIPSNDDL
jgi:hypothetical protein